jgi:outer membrane receptor protein involved in Fe transport
VRGTLRNGLRWSAGLFRGDSHDDILFVADEQAGFGYFRNFGGTRRAGLELGLDARVGSFAVGGGFTHLDATYRSAEVVNGAANSRNDGVAPGFEGNISIEPGDRIPLIPRRLLHAYAEWASTPRLSLDADLVHAGGAYARGNENNGHAPDGLYYLGPGATPGYTVLGLGATFKATIHVLAFAKVTNLLDREYYTAAQLGTTGFTQTGAVASRPFAEPVIGGERPLLHTTFFAPGAPRMLWLGVRMDLGRKSATTR